jgi:DNA invertase Pin-like site-specific DNA recombinase
VAISDKKASDMFNLPPSKRTIEDLERYFATVEKSSTKILPKEKRRYVLYLRKSTDDESKQVRSLEDQKTECLELANRLDISIKGEDILEESASAKTSGNRPIFEEMLRGFIVGKYHGLIAWSPDRLSRNMREAGEIIEMIDFEQIQDLHFKTYQFDNTPNGKMLLGILFATSKQYSDKLSVDVIRGITGSIRDGKYVGQIKKGYYADRDTGYFMPDGHNWELLRQAVIMRLYEGKTNVEIAKFLNDAHFSVRRDQDSEYKINNITKNIVGEVFVDPFYFGLYQYGKNIANLTDNYNFLPLVTPDEHVQLNKKIAFDFNENHKIKKASSNRLDYGLLRGKVICDYCDNVMQFQHQEIKRGKNKGKWLISYYCRNGDCQRHKDKNLQKSIRAKYVMAFVEWTLRNCTKKSKEAYRLYIDKLRVKLAQDLAIAKRKLKEAEDSFRANEKAYMKYQEFQINHPDEYKKHHNRKLEHYSNLIDVAKHSVASNKDKLGELKRGLPTEDEFYELINSYLLRLLNTGDLMEQDAICNELVSNLRAGDNSISGITLNKPYDLLVDMDKIFSGRGERIRTSGLIVPNDAR